MNERERVERAERMIRNDDDATFDRNVLAISVCERVADAKLLERTLDEIEARAWRERCKRRVDALFARDATQQIDDRCEKLRARPAANCGNFS